MEYLNKVYRYLISNYIFNMAKIGSHSTHNFFLEFFFDMGCSIESATKKYIHNVHFLLVHKIFHLSLQIKI
jgi:hypothetical protein